MSVFGIKSNKCKQEVIPANQVFDVVYPVGSIYMSANNVNPSTLFGGTWVPINGKFLLASSSGRAAGTTGGAETVSYTPAGTVGNHTLTAAEMPKHSHTYAKSAANTGSTTLTTAMIPAHTHSYYRASGYTGGTKLTINQIPAHSHYYYMTPSTSTEAGATRAKLAIKQSSAMDASQQTSQTGGGQEHNHSISASSESSGSAGSSGGHTHSISTSSTASSEAGSGGAHNHGFTGTAATINKMPPYIVVNVWQRTA